MAKRYRLKPNTSVPPCPKCGGNTEFDCHSSQFAEDCCEIWLTCACGRNPFSSDDRIEDVWGGVGEENFWHTLGYYKELLAEQAAAV